MEHIWYIGAGVILALAGDKGLAIWMRLERDRRVQAAREVLKKNGLHAHTYLAAMGSEPGELRSALSTLEHTGAVVIDGDGRMVGRLLQTAQLVRGLRLVVDNT